MPQLPQELIDAIIEDVPGSSLKACSLAATAFVTSSQRRLFCWMSLSDIPSYERTAILLASSPHLAKYFHFLALDIKVIPTEFVLLKLILAQLTELEHLSIIGDVMFGWNQLERNPCLIDILSLPTLTAFAVKDLGDVPSALISRALASFEQVVLSSVNIVDEEQDTEDWSSPGNLWHLVVVLDYDEMNAITSWALDAKRLQLLRQIKRLSLMSPAFPKLLFPQLIKLLSASSSTLQHLEIELNAPPPALPTLPSLTVLDLILDVEVAKNPARFNSILSDTVASMPHLEVLTIALLDAPLNGTARPQWTSHRPGQWADLDSTLTDLPNLREANLSLRNFGSEPQRYAVFVQYMQAHLPRAFDAGLIKFSSDFCFLHPMDRFARMFYPRVLVELKLRIIIYFLPVPTTDLSQLENL
ncbi:hypothetical protein C8F04DRAFT_1390766 [Mycena alexandri]|uniref:Uncharacterized protein n=1 Tax=Mycena alexandri TaxID=1745969 RepID=A0AAD6TA64_9AGAR|nr:hypothetical protein C8F04DRAFT_1390766 [Mycena alexandri]